MSVVVLGAGYAGITAARQLEAALPDEVDLVVVNDTSMHLVRHEVHRVIRDPAFAEDIKIELDELLDSADVLIDRVTAVDIEDRRVTLENGTLDYDAAVVCLGAETAFHALPGVKEHAIPLREVAHARRIRRRYLECLDDGQGRVIVGGAGLSGVQVAGELATLAVECDAAEVADIMLLERLDSVAPGFSTDFQTAIHDALEARNVQIRTNVTVESATAASVSTDTGVVPYDLFVWTGGIQGPNALGGDRPRVRSDLRAGTRTFVIGDAARVIDRDGEAVPATAQAAIREAKVAATNVARLVRNDEGTFDPRLSKFEFSPRAWVVSVGDGAVAQVGPTVLTGSAALAVKATAGVGYLSSVGAVQRAVDIAREEFGGD